MITSQVFSPKEERKRKGAMQKQQNSEADSPPKRRKRKSNCALFLAPPPSLEGDVDSESDSDEGKEETPLKKRIPRSSLSVSTSALRVSVSPPPFRAPRSRSPPPFAVPRNRSPAPFGAPRNRSPQPFGVPRNGSPQPFEVPRNESPSPFRVPRNRSPSPGVPRSPYAPPRSATPFGRVSKDQVLVESTPFLLEEPGIGRGRIVAAGEEKIKEGEEEEEDEEWQDEGRPPINTMQKIGFTLSLCGLVIVFVCLGLYFGLPSIVNFQFESIFIVDSTSSNGFNTWAHTCEGLFPPLYQSFFFFNLTNYDEVVSQNKIPVFDKVGPYTYLACKTKTNPLFAEDGETVTYTMDNEFQFQEKRSNGTENDRIVSLNPIPLGLSMLTKTEDSLAVALMFSYMSQMGRYFNEIFPSFVLNEYFIQEATANRVRLTRTYTKTTGSFVEVWANYTTEDIQNKGWSTEDWDLMYLAPYNLDRPTMIEKEIALLLWDNTQNLSMTNENYESQSTWIAAEESDDSATDLIINSFPGLTTNQLTIIILWRSDFKTAYMGSLFNYINNLTAAQEPGNYVSTLEDIGGLQWATDGVLGSTVYNTSPKNLSVVKNINLSTFHDLLFYARNSQYIIPSMFPPEMAYFQSSDSAPDETQSFCVDLYWQLFSASSPFSLLNPGVFLQYTFCDHQRELYLNGGAELSPNCTIFFEQYNWTDTQQTNFHEYMWAYTYPNLGDIVYRPEVGLGIINVKVVKERLLESRSLVMNDDYNDIPCTFRTGKENTKTTGQIVEWDGQFELCSYNGPDCSFLEGYWPENVPVEGFGDPRQFGVDLGESGEDLLIWSDVCLRPMTYGNRGKQTVEGISAIKFAIDDETFPFGLDATYDQNIQGFANMSHLSMKSTQTQIRDFNLIITNLGGEKYNLTVSQDSVIYPFFISFPDFYNCDPFIATTVEINIDPNQSITENSYYLIEPNTGMAIDTLNQMQYNLFLQKNMTSWKYFSNITGPNDEVMWPLFVLSEVQELSPDTADELKAYFQLIPRAAQYCLWIGVPASVLVVLVGSYISVVYETSPEIFKRRTMNKTPLQSPSSGNIN